jgi:hypothetical protein
MTLEKTRKMVYLRQRNEEYKEILTEYKDLKAQPQLKPLCVPFAPSLYSLLFLIGA